MRRIRRFGRRIAASLTTAALIASEVAHSAEGALAKHPLEYPLKQYAWVLTIALLGGFVSWVGKVRSGKVRAWSLLTLIGELATSALAGLLCFWLCEWRDFDQLLTISLVGISGHMGTRALVLAERAAEKKFGVTGPAPLDDHRPS